MKAKSQEYNDNTGGNTDLCFSCRTYYTLEDFKTSEGKNVCKNCFNKYQKLCKNSNVSFIEEKRNQEHFSHWYAGIIDHIDVYCVVNGKKVFIRGYVPGESDTEMKRAEIFNLKMQFLKSNLKNIRFYGDLEILKEYKFWFELEKEDYFYRIQGNCEKYSNAFNFKTNDINEIFKLLKYHYNLSEEQKRKIKELIEKEHTYFTNENKDGFGITNFHFKDYSECDFNQRYETYKNQIKYIELEGGKN